MFGPPFLWLQVGVCSGLVLGFLAAVLALHFILNRRTGGPFSPKVSAPYGGSSSLTYQSPGASVTLNASPTPAGHMGLSACTGTLLLVLIITGCPGQVIYGTSWCGTATRPIRVTLRLPPEHQRRHALLHDCCGSHPQSYAACRDNLVFASGMPSCC